MLVPIIFRLLLKLEGIPLRSQIEWKLERRYGAFLIIQVSDLSYPVSCCSY